MITPDTSTLIAFFSGDLALDTERLKISLRDGSLVLTPVVVSEILSDSKLPKAHEQAILALPRIETDNGFWERVGFLRRTILIKKYKCRLADAMIAQCCLDHDLTLLTRDSDFRRFAQVTKLKLMIGN